MPTIVARVLRRYLVLVLTFVWLAPAYGNVTGKWATTGPFPDPFVFDVVQSGSSLTMNLNFPLSGTINPGGSFGVSFSGGGFSVGMGGLFLVNEKYFAANTGAFSFGTPTFGTLTGIRCECADGNSTPGDGCDARCQIEPCFTCSGMPSVCTPSPDGSTCDDRNACTGGETCTAGVCGGGSAVVPCVNLSGSWFVRERSVNGPEQVSYRTTIRQLGTALELGGATLPGVIGAIDPSTGAFDTWEPIPSFNCFLETRHGTAAPDGNTFSATGNDHTQVVDECVLDPVEVTAWRCGSGTVDPGEQCDDGNTADGDGCSATCQSEFCLSHVDGTPCDDGDPCTSGDACQGGTCVGTVAAGAPCDDGLACTSGDVCDASGACTGTPACGACGACSAVSGCVPLANGVPCDDGDQCTSDVCQAGACVSTPTPGATCDDGVACTSNDVCVGGVCQGTSNCGPCRDCAGASGCVGAPAAVCAAPDAGGASLAIADAGDPTRVSVAVRWTQTAGGSIDFGAPDVSDSYGVCVFDTSTPTPALLFRAVAPAADGCVAGPCWTPKPNGGFVYKDTARTPDGLIALVLKRKKTGVVTVSARGKGPLLLGRSLGLPITPVPVPFTAQVVGAGGACVGAEFTPGTVTKNQAGKLKARVN